MNHLRNDFRTLLITCWLALGAAITGFTWSYVQPYRISSTRLALIHLFGIAAPVVIISILLAGCAILVLRCRKDASEWRVAKLHVPLIALIAVSLVAIALVFFLGGSAHSSSAE